MREALLSVGAFDGARTFILSAGRPLDRALFRYIFEGAPCEAVLEALAAYRNPDGGFGNALEPDLRDPGSSSLCTSIALQVMRSVKVTKNEPLAVGAVAYLVDTLDIEKARWRIIPQSATASPHAPHWSHTSDEELFGRFSLNPTAELLGYLYESRARVPREMLSAVERGVLHHLEGLSSIEMHELLCYLRLFKTESLPGPVRSELRRLLSPLVDAAIELDPSKWEGYCLRPLQVIDDPGSPFLHGRENAVEADLAHEISTQCEHGFWVPTWTWDGAYPQTWEIARREWSSVLTLDKLTVLKRFRRIEGLA